MTDHLEASLYDSNENDDKNDTLTNLIPGETTETFPEKFKRKFGQIPKTIFACLFMLLLGIIVIIIPSVSNSIIKGKKIGLYIVGSILLIPSIYVAYILYKVFTDAPGYQIDGLPLWDE